MGADTSASHGAMSLATAPRSSRKRKHDECATSSTSADASTDATAPGTWNDTDPATPPRSREAEPAARRPRNVYESTSHLSLLLPADPVRLTIIIPSRFRPCPPRSFDEIYRRATTQRFYVLTRTRCGMPECPEEVVELTGSTGNIYTVVVARQPTCDCPHALAGNQCKHVLYVLSRVLRAPFEYVYQLALLSSELREIFANAPPPPPASGEEEGGGSGDGDGRRKPVEGDCPICFCEMEAEGGEPVVWCRAACGQNIHKGCFETWAATKRRQAAGGGKAEVTCPYCRSVWEGDGDMIKKIERNGVRNAEGYVNVASQLGISTERDYSTYSRWWSGHPSSYRRGYYY